MADAGLAGCPTSEGARGEGVNSVQGGGGRLVGVVVDGWGGRYPRIRWTMAWERRRGRGKRLEGRGEAAPLTRDTPSPCNSSRAAVVGRVSGGRDAKDNLKRGKRG